MKKIIIFIIVSLFLVPVPAFAQMYEKECDFPRLYGQNKEKVRGERTIFETDDIFIFIEHYSIDQEVYHNPYSITHYKNFVSHASSKWKVLDEDKIDVDDIFDEEGRLKRYVVIDFGATIFFSRFVPLGDNIIFRTCISPDPEYEETYYDMESGDYGKAADMVEHFLIPLVSNTLEKGDEK